MLISTSYSNAKMYLSAAKQRKEKTTKTRNFTFIAWFVCSLPQYVCLSIFPSSFSFSVARVVVVVALVSSCVFFFSNTMAHLWWQISFNKLNHRQCVQSYKPGVFKYMCVFVYVSVCLFVNSFVSNWFLIAVSTYSDFFLVQSNYGLAKSIFNCKRKGVDNCFTHWCDDHYGCIGNDSYTDGDHINSISTVNVQVSDKRRRRRNSIWAAMM